MGSSLETRAEGAPGLIDALYLREIILTDVVDMAQPAVSEYPKMDVAALGSPKPCCRLISGWRLPVGY